MNKNSPNLFLILSESAHLYSSKRLEEEAHKLGYRIGHHNPYQTALELAGANKPKSTENKNIVIHRTTGVRYDDHDLLFSTSLEDQGFKVINPIKSLTTFRNKDFQQLFFNRFHIPFIPSISIRGKLNEEN